MEIIKNKENETLELGINHSIYVKYNNTISNDQNIKGGIMDVSILIGICLALYCIVLYIVKDKLKKEYRKGYKDGMKFINLRNKDISKYHKEIK